MRAPRWSLAVVVVCGLTIAAGSNGVHAFGALTSGANRCLVHVTRADGLPGCLSAIVAPGLDAQQEARPAPEAAPARDAAAKAPADTPTANAADGPIQAPTPAPPAPVPVVKPEAPAGVQPAPPVNPPSAPGIAFSDGFQSAAAGGPPGAAWTQDAGSWEVIQDGPGHALAFGGGSTIGEAVTGSASWASYRVSATVRPNGGSSAGLVARYVSKASHYACLLQGGKTLLLGKYVDGRWTVLGSAPFSFYAGEWQPLIFQARGGDLSCSAQSGPIITVTDTTFATGRAGVEASGAGDFAAFSARGI